MKKVILFLLAAGSFAANAQSKPQSLKDLLYGGKLKLDSTAVIKKGDDLSSKIDTSTKKPVEPAKPKAAVATDDLGNKVGTANVTATGLYANDSASAATGGTKDNVPAKSNTKLWKQYTDSLVSTLKTELLPSKKIKKDTYFLIVDYEIGLDGAVNVTGVASTPENAFLQDEIKKRMVLTAPQLAPVLDSANKPRKTKKKYNFSITKE